MNPQPRNHQNNYDPWICPDIGTYWQLAKVRGSDKVVLKSRQGKGQFPFSSMEGFALQHFTGNLAIATPGDLLNIRLNSQDSSSSAILLQF